MLPPYTRYEEQEPPRGPRARLPPCPLSTPSPRKFPGEPLTAVEPEEEAM